MPNLKRLMLTFLGILLLAYIMLLSVYPSWILGAALFISTALLVGLLFFFQSALSKRFSGPDRSIDTVREDTAPENTKNPLPSSGLMTSSNVEDSTQNISETLSELKEKNAQGEAILASMKDGVLVLNEQDRIVSMNAEAEKLLEIKASEVTGKLIGGAIHGSALRDILINKEKQEGEPVEVEIYHQEERVKYLQVSRTKLEKYSTDSELSGSVVVLTDISKLKSLEKIRQDFVANVSHELKTPVTSIIGFVETLLDGAMEKPEETKRFLSIIQGQSDRLLAIIEDLLMLAKLESTPTDPEFELGKVIDGIKRATRLSLHRALGKQITINTEAAPELKINADWSLLEQAIVNLVDNAIKYSENGTTVTVSAEPIDDFIAIKVSDQGPGIPEKSLSRIFERFYRVDKARSRSLGGTGLGLAIVKHVAHFHGGRVDVKSRLGEGSEFSVILPRA